MPGLLRFFKVPEGPASPLWWVARTPFVLMQQCRPVCQCSPTGRRPLWWTAASGDRSRSLIVIDIPEPEGQRPAPRGGTDRTIVATCQNHGSRGFCNLRLTKVDGEIVLNPVMKRLVAHGFHVPHA